MSVNVTDTELYYNASLLQELNDSRMQFNLPVIICLSIVMIVGVFGNILVTIVYTFFLTRNAANFYISLLAVVDLTNCWFCLPYQIFSMSNPYMNGYDVLCRNERFLENLLNLISGFILVSVASERYFKICHPLEPFVKSRAKSIAIVVFILSLSLSWPQYILNGRQTQKIGKDGVIGVYCSYDDEFNGSIYVFLFHGLLFLVYFISFCALLFFYSKILAAILRRRLQFRENAKANEPDSENKKQNSIKNTTRDRLGSVSGVPKMRLSRTTLCLTLITVTAFIGYVPFLSITTLRFSGSYLQTTLTPSGEYYHYGSSKSVDLACSLLLKSYFINSAINPVIYSLINQTFRDRTKIAFRKIVKKLCRH